MHDTTTALAGLVLDTAQTAGNALDGMVAETAGRPPIPAPDLYPILGQLEGLAYQLDQAVRQLGQSLQASLAVYDMVDDNPNVDPATAVATAREWLDEVAAAALSMGHAVDRARNTIAGQAIRSVQPTSSPGADR